MRSLRQGEGRGGEAAGRRGRRRHIQRGQLATHLYQAQRPSQHRQQHSSRRAKTESDFSSPFNSEREVGPASGGAQPDRIEYERRQATSALAEHACGWRYLGTRVWWRRRSEQERETKLSFEKVDRLGRTENTHAQDDTEVGREIKSAQAVNLTF